MGDQLLRQRAPRLTLRARLRALLEQGPTNVKDAAAALDHDYRMVDRRLREMWKAGEVTRSSVGHPVDDFAWEYRLVNRCQTCWADLSRDSHHPDCKEKS